MRRNDSTRERFERRVRKLEEFGHRGAGTEFEDRAADYVAAELRASGIEATKETFDGSNSLGARLLVHVAIAAIGIALIWVLPLMTVLIGITVLVSFTGEASTRFRLFSRLLPKARSRNVVGRILPRRCNPHLHRLIVCAHIDTQRTGLMWHDRVVRPFTAFFQKAYGPMKSPSFLLTSAFAAQTLVGIITMLWPGNHLFMPAFGIITIVYGFSGFLLADWSRGQFTPGACDNATGVAAAIDLAERWAGEPIDNVELVVLLCGCEESGALGAAAWLDAHRAELKTGSSSFLVLDTLGYGPPRFLGTEHTLAAVPVRYPRKMLDVCKNAAQRLGLNGAGPYTLPTASDATAFLNRGIPGAAVLTFEDGVYIPNYHQMTDTSERLDFDVAWRATHFGWEVLKELALLSKRTTVTR